MCLCIAVFLTIYEITDVELVRNVFCYNIFMVAGYAYYRKTSLKTIYLVGGFSLAFLLTSRVCHIHLCPMQEHKFPPDIVFLAYNMLLLAGLALLLRHVKLPNWRILRFWNKSGYNIYLYQNIPYTLMALAIKHGFAFSNRWVQMLFSMIVIFCFCTLLFFVCQVLKAFLIHKPADNRMGNRPTET